jgi:hypothetical protein
MTDEIMIPELEANGLEVGGDVMVGRAGIGSVSISHAVTRDRVRSAYD